MDTADRVRVLSREGFTKRAIAAIINSEPAEIASAMLDARHQPTLIGSGGLVPKGAYDPTVGYSKFDVVAAPDGKLYYATADAAPAEAPGGGNAVVCQLRGRQGFQKDRIGSTTRQLVISDATPTWVGTGHRAVVGAITPTTGNYTVRVRAVATSGPITVNVYAGTATYPINGDGSYLGSIDVESGAEGTLGPFAAANGPALGFFEAKNGSNGIIEVQGSANLVDPPSTKWAPLNPLV